MFIIVGFTHCILRAQLAYRLLNFKYTLSYDLVRWVCLFFYFFFLCVLIFFQRLRQLFYKSKDSKKTMHNTETK